MFVFGSSGLRNDQDGGGEHSYHFFLFASEANILSHVLRRRRPFS